MMFKETQKIISYYQKLILWDIIVDLFYDHHKKGKSVVIVMWHTFSADVVLQRMKQRLELYLTDYERWVNILPEKEKIYLL